MKSLVQYLLFFSLSVAVEPSFAHDMHKEETAGFLLKSVVETASDLKTQKDFKSINTPEAWSQLIDGLAKDYGGHSVCRALNSLKTSDLGLFVDYLEFSNGKKLPCAAQLVNEYENFLYLESDKLVKQHSPDEAKLYLANSSVTIERVIRSKRGLSFPEADSRLPDKTIILTFDDGPHPRRTAQILKILDQENVKATFFMLGRMVRNNPDLARLVASKGHAIGGHTVNHPDLSKRSYKSAINEITQGFEILDSVIGFVDPFFRFPYGARPASLKQWIADRNIHDFFWSIDSLDWQKRNPSTLLDYAIRTTVSYRKGIVLFHDIHPQTVAVLPAYIKAMKNRGFKFAIYSDRSGE